MKEVTRTVYESQDGKQFLTIAECEAYENENYQIHLVGLTIAQVEAALSREDPILAEIIERAGNKIATARREAGELKRVDRRRSTPEKETVHPVAKSEPAPILTPITVAPDLVATRQHLDIDTPLVDHENAEADAA